MIDVSEQFKDVAKSNAKIAVGQLVVGTETLSSDSISSFAVTRSAGTDDVLTIGSVVSAQLDMTVKRDMLPQYIHGLSVVPKMGYMVDGSPQLCSLGVMYIDDTVSERSGLFYNLTAYDILASGVCDSVVPAGVWDPQGDSVTVVTNLAKLIDPTNYDEYVDVDSFTTIGPYLPLNVSLPEGATIRDALSLMGVACGGNIMTGADGRIKLVAGPASRDAADAVESFSGGDVRSGGFSLVAKDSSAVTYIAAEVEITTVEIVSDDEDFEEDENSESEPEQRTKTETVRFEFPSESERVANGTGILVDGNILPVVNGSAEEALSDIWTRFIWNYGNYSESNKSCAVYQPFELTTKGCPYIEPMDLISCVDYPYDTTPVALIPVTVTHTYNGAISSSYSAAAISDDSTEVGQSSTLTISSVSDAMRPAAEYIQQLLTYNLTASRLAADHADIVDIRGNSGWFDNLSTMFMSADVANIGEATIESLLSKSGRFSYIESGDVTTATLTATRINGGDIIGGTITANSIRLVGSDGVIYEINKETLGTDSDVFRAYENNEVDESLGPDHLKNYIHGDVLAFASIKADKIDVDDLNALKATIGGLHISDRGIQSYSSSTLENPMVSISTRAETSLLVMQALA